ncbi:PIG-L family deacetylase [Marine Group I thaumarchaeote]|nr:PIG-L family deacetylase [Marine Group I thaumarchaeote]
MNILIIAAHPDDEVLGMGGTIAKHTSQHDTVSIIYMATGITGRRELSESEYEIKNIPKKIQEDWQKEIGKLRQDANKSARLLKVKNVKFFDFPDNEMDGIHLLKVVKVIEKEIKTAKPDRIYTNHYGDLNVDHKVVYNATLVACRPTNFPVKEILSFEVLSSTEWSYPYNFNPNYFINIEKYLGKKIKAMELFVNEIRKFPHPRSSENIKHVARRWGSVSGFNAAEAFELIRRLDK